MGLACVTAAMLYLGAKPEPMAGITFMGFVFFIYIINRFTDVQEDFANDVDKAVFFTSHKSLLKIGIVALVLAVMALAALNKLSLFHLVLLGTGVLYSYRLIPWYKKGEGIVYCRIKELPLVKNLAVSALWGLSVFLIPILVAQIPVPNPFLTGLIVLAVIISTFNNTLFDDITDVIGDRLSNTATLPTLMGVKRCYSLLWGLNLVWISALALLFSLGRIDVYHFVFFMVLALYPLTYIISYQRNWIKKSAVDLLMELDLLILACGLSLLTLAPRAFS
jgi:4-hydroxybenzoate polyprenyltransferase